MGQIGPKWDQFGTIWDQISVQFGSSEKSRIYPIWADVAQLVPNLTFLFHKYEVGEDETEGQGNVSLFLSLSYFHIRTT